MACVAWTAPRAMRLDPEGLLRIQSVPLYGPVKPTQLRFWPDPQPVVDRLGRAFFRQLPEAPGVYLMCGLGGTVLYVGKARNLRHRLASYRVANPDRLPRRLLRLLYQVERIDWEVCRDEESALQREAELLLLLRPRFNRAGVWPKPKRYLLWREIPDGLELALAAEPETGWLQAGPAGSQLAGVYGALVRLLWFLLQPDLGLVDMPNGWFKGRQGFKVLIPRSPAVHANAGGDFLRLLVQGNREGALRMLVPARTAFDQAVRDEDMAFLNDHCLSAVSSVQVLRNESAQQK